MLKIKQHKEEKIMIKQTGRKIIITAFAGAMLFGGIAFTPDKSDAAKNVTITKSVNVYKGKTVKIKLSNNKKTVTWSVIKGSKNISLSNKGKTGVTVTGRNVGKATVQAKAGGKKYVCSVTVKKAAADADAKKGTLTNANMEYWGVKDKGSIVIPEGVKKIGFAAFASSEITSVKFPKSLEIIDDYAFRDTKLSSVTIPATVSKIGEGAFDSCESLKSVTLSEGLTTIGEGCFLNCSSLTSVTIPDSVENIGEESFEYEIKITWKGTTYNDYDEFLAAF